MGTLVPDSALNSPCGGAICPLLAVDPYLSLGSQSAPSDDSQPGSRCRQGTDAYGFSQTAQRG